MSKTKQKRQTYNDDIVNELKIKYGFTRDYIIKSIRGDRVGTIPIQIQEEYKKANSAARKIALDKINNA